MPSCWCCGATSPRPRIDWADRAMLAGHGAWLASGSGPAPLDLLAPLRAQRGALAARQLGHDELVGVIDPLLDLVVVDRPVQRHRVPMPLVEVVAGPHRPVRRPERFRSRRAAVDPDPGSGRGLGAER